MLMVFNACDKVYQWLTAGQCFSSGTPASPTNKIDCHDVTEILLKVASSTKTITITTLVVIGTDCTGSCKSNYHTITTTTKPSLELLPSSPVCSVLPNCNILFFSLSFVYHWSCFVYFVRPDCDFFSSSIYLLLYLVPVFVLNQY
jgi:hypothetical protein